MTIPKAEDVTTRDQARDLAVEWQHWQSDQSMSYLELSNWQAFFAELAERFDLNEEFAENGII